MQTAYAHVTITSAQAAFNRSMNKVRTSVEWSYGEVKQYFTSQDFQRKLIVAKAPIAIMYVLSVILRNFKTCMGHGRQGPAYFDCDPPTFEQYCTFQ